ncbi:MAG TPA: phosphoenolpyruvate carboxykinase (GTP) [Steroidobacteraceae bacterium]|nr:phosphoenolpyruvate carboxykinase (GTP) [Steroidobacteraceae bacterium]
MATAPQHITSLASLNRDVANWVEEVARLTQPDRIHWCDGSESEFQMLERELVAKRELLPLNQGEFPGCHLYRSNPSDVARVEHLTFVCTEDQEDAGPNNNWMAPEDAHQKMDALFAGCMKGRTLYVVPYCMGPIDSPFSRCGVEITDSAYVVLNMQLMTRMGLPALERISDGGSFVKGLHSTGDLNPDRRFIMHFPEELTIKSFGSGYGGNALLGKKCHALRIASWQARTEGWLAEHMLIVGIENPQGEIHYLACAFPSACGKTNLAMLIPPASYRGWKVWTVGDDIAWLHPGKDGRLYAINPESGYFGVVPGTNSKTNRNAYETIRRDTIFTNVGVTADNQPWWEGLSEGAPVTDWQGRPYDPANGPAAQPNSRFTVAAKLNPAYSKMADAPGGVPISAIVFGGRRRTLAPLVFQARNWLHGVLLGAGVASETTAAITGKVGVLRRDPMAMKPFAGYNFGDYWSHWINVGAKLKSPPQIFHVNWFRQDGAGKFLWPGFGDNLRVLRWMIDRCKGTANARDTAIGQLPHPQDLDTQGLELAPGALEELLAVDPTLWRAEFKGIADYFGEFGTRIPPALATELNDSLTRVTADASD